MELHPLPRSPSHPGDRLTIGRVLALAWRGWLACRWQMLLVVLPITIAHFWVAAFLQPYLMVWAPANWQFVLNSWFAGVIELVPFAALYVGVMRYAGNERSGWRDVLRLPWKRLPRALVARLVLPVIAYWPIGAFNWNREDLALTAIDSLIVVVNVLTVETLVFVYLPILLMEDRPLVGALRHGIEMIKPRRWRILVLVIIRWVVLYPLSIGMPILYAAIQPEASWLTWCALWVCALIIGISLDGCVKAAAYHLLRREQDAVEPHAVAQVFD